MNSKNVDLNYKRTLMRILDSGTMDDNPRAVYADGTPAHSLYITQVCEHYDISKGEYPITSLRPTAIKTGFAEILWIYSMQSNSLSDAKLLGINWWDEWNIGDGTIGQRYGATVKRHNIIDNLLKGMENNLFGRRHIIDLWQYEDMSEEGGLDPCAFMVMFTPRKVDGKLYLDSTLIQRSNDYIMAGFINKMQYVILTKMICGHLSTVGIDIEVGVFCHVVQNLHIYCRHIKAANELLARETIQDMGFSLYMPKKSFYDYCKSDLLVTFSNAPKPISESLEIAI